MFFKKSKLNFTEQQASMQTIANAYKCSVLEVKDFYKSFQAEALATDLVSPKQAEEAIALLNEQKYVQAAQLRVNAENTPAAIMELWSREALSEYIKVSSSNLKSNETHRIASLVTLARHNKCSVEWVKETFRSGMINNKISVKGAKLVIQTLKPRVYDEARKLNIAPMDTTSAIQIEWINDYISDKSFSARWETKEDMLEDMYSLNPDFELVYKSGDAERKRQFALANYDFISYVNKQIKWFDLEAHTLLGYASSSIRERDYDRALMLLEKAFALGDESVTAELYNARGKVLFATSHIEEALADFNKAIEVISRREGDNEIYLNELMLNKTIVQDRIKATAKLRSNVGNTNNKSTSASNEDEEAKVKAQAKTTLKGSLANLTFKKTDGEATNLNEQDEDFI